MTPAEALERVRRFIEGSELPRDYNDVYAALFDLQAHIERLEGKARIADEIALIVARLRGQMEEALDSAASGKPIDENWPGYEC